MEQLRLIGAFGDYLSERREEILTKKVLVSPNGGIGEITKVRAFQ